MKKINKKGFTLIELMIVIAIIAILAAILVPNFVKARAQGQLTSCKSNLKNIGTACEMYAADHNGRYPSGLTTLADTGESSPYMKSIPTCPCVGVGTAYGYTCTSNPDYYGIDCTTGNHAQAGIDGLGFPQYDSVAGLMAPTSEIGSATTGSISANKPSGS